MADKNGMKDLNLIGVGTTVDGKIRTQGSLRVDGKLTGEVHAAENLAIGITGEVEGAVNGRNVTVGGKVKGNITAVDKLVLEGKSSVRGDVKAAKLVIDEGATFDGRISMTETRPGGQNY
ncbi:MAG: polymer-forming cytoskeletal protein [Ignavibacteriales bacterium]|nr:polymer-forming cytoskeletal protein [Ignavibacteriales bacterium]